MPAECYFLPSVSVAPLTLEALAARFQAAGLPPTVHPCGLDHAWLGFALHATQLYVSIELGRVALVTLELSLREDADLFLAVERVLLAAGFSIEEPSSPELHA